MKMLVDPSKPRSDGPLDDDQLVAAYPWPDGRRWVRGMMVTTLDGAAAGPDGLSGSISSEADKRVFDAVRRLADVVLVGAQTIRAERYGAMRARADDAEVRRSLGLAPAPALAVVSASLNLPWDEPMFTESSVRPIVVTHDSADRQRLEVARAHADVVVLPGDWVQVGPALDALEARGLRRVVCEGGPTLLMALIREDLLDEADIALSPTFVGGGHTPRTPVLDAPSRFDLVQVIAGDGFLMNRYLRAAA